MICRNCLRRASALRPSLQFRQFTSTPFLPSPESVQARDSTPAATSTGIAQPFSNPLTSSGPPKPKPTKSSAPKISIAPAGTILRGLNYVKGREDPVALAEEEYPEWLWKTLDKEEVEGGEEGAGDEFSKSKKLRRKAAKRQRKLEARLEAMGELASLAPKIPITRQSVDLAANEEGSVQGALEAERVREELRGAMRRERRKGIKEANFLKGM